MYNCIVITAGEKNRNFYYVNQIKKSSETVQVQMSGVLQVQKEE